MIFSGLAVTASGSKVDGPAAIPPAATTITLVTDGSDGARRIEAVLGTGDQAGAVPYHRISGRRPSVAQSDVAVPRSVVA